ncbi:bacteriocin immunity protein [Leclercia sp. Marseille-Q4284]|uniref:bacteriocin immunity protein n=1 Tax=Leclercia sp. Marseille-Q4284 TaxID=2866582 RepID=UPI001CE3FB2E|nr:bacteriocin immunity protein [Leclercia sp. Marseille-Q4284]
MKNISDYTESEFLEFVRRLCDFANTTESEDIKNILEFNRLTEHPAGSDLIFYPEDGQDDSPEGIVQQVKEWRKANGKPGFRGE